jgi:hypothetical protein
MMLTSIVAPDVDSTVYRGVFARFTEIDPNMAWFNIDKLEEAAESDLSEVVIPENLRPNYSPFFFQFDASKHLFVFETNGSSERVAPQQVEKFVRGLAARVTPDVGISVNLVADKSAVASVLGMPVLRHLTIVVERPNPDVNQKVEERVRARLARLNAERETLSLDAAPSQSIKADPPLRQLALVGAANGEVIGVGRDSEGLPRKISTKQFPLTAAQRYDPDLTSPNQAFEAAAEKVKGQREAEAPNEQG